MKLLSSFWPKVTVAMCLVEATVAVVAFAILFFVEYAWGNKDSGLLGHFIRAGLPPFFFASGVLHLSEGLTKMREAHLKWYKQGNVLRGLELVSFSLLCLLIFGQAQFFLKRHNVNLPCFQQGRRGQVAFAAPEVFQLSQDRGVRVRQETCLDMVGDGA